MDTLSNIISHLNPKDQKAFINLSSKGLNDEFIINSLETAKRNFDRAQSLQIVRSVNLINKINEIYGNSRIYPITLTFYQKDVLLLKELDVLSFIRRAQTVVFEGAERMVIEAKHSGTTCESSGSTEWHYGMADPNVWTWEQPTSLREILNSDTVTAVRRLDLEEERETAELVVELSWIVFGGDINWTTTKTSGLLSAQRGDVSAEEILLNPKLRNIQTLKLMECDRAVLVNVSTLANLESLDLSWTDVVDVSALAKLTNLKSLKF
jgi:hypothetical protein